MKSPSPKVRLENISSSKVTITSGDVDAMIGIPNICKIPRSFSNLYKAISERRKDKFRRQMLSNRISYLYLISIGNTFPKLFKLVGDQFNTRTSLLFKNNFICRYCLKQFDNPSKLGGHISRIHSDETKQIKEQHQENMVLRQFLKSPSNKNNHNPKPSNENESEDEREREKELIQNNLLHQRQQRNQTNMNSSQKSKTKNTTPTKNDKKSESKNKDQPQLSPKLLNKQQIKQQKSLKKPQSILKNKSKVLSTQQITLKTRQVKGSPNKSLPKQSPSKNKSTQILDDKGQVVFKKTKKTIKSQFNQS